MIECLKKSGLEIKEIKQFMEWCSQGSSTYEKRHELFLHQQEIVEQKIEKLEKVLEASSVSNAGIMSRQFKMEMKSG